MKSLSNLHILYENRILSILIVTVKIYQLYQDFVKRIIAGPHY